MCGSPRSPGIDLLGSPCIASASLALRAPANTAEVLRATRPPKATRLLLRGAGKASEADSRRGKPSKAKDSRDSREGPARDMAKLMTFQKHDYAIELDLYASKIPNRRDPLAAFVIAALLRGPYPPNMSKTHRNIQGFVAGWVGILHVFRIFYGMIRNGPPGP